MAFRLVTSGGTVVNPAVVNMRASGIIRQGGIVVYDDAANAVSSSLGGTGASITNIIGISLDYVQGAGDTFIRVIPFAPGQLWEADTISAVSTANLFLRHQLASDQLVRNITASTTGTNSYESISTGIFFAYAQTGLETGSGKLIGTFLQRVPFRGKDGVTATT